MKKKLAIIVLFFFIIIYFVSSNVFAYTEVAVQQDVYYFTYQDTLAIQNLLARSNIHSAPDILNFLRNNTSITDAVSSELLYFGILNNGYQLDLVLYGNNSIINSTIVNDYVYNGIQTPGFTLSNVITLRMSSGSPQDNNFIYSAFRNTSRTLPATYYKASREYLFSTYSETDNYSNVLSAINENLQELRNDLNNNTSVQQETQNFIKDDTEVSDNTISDFTNDINVDSVDSSATTNIFELFNIIDSQDNEQTTEIPINFSFFGQNLTFTIDRFLTGNLLYSVLGSTGGDIISNAVRLIWTYFIFIFIVKNIISLIDKIKAGEIDKINTKNVLVDAL